MAARRPKVDIFSPISGGLSEYDAELVKRTRDREEATSNREAKADAIVRALAEDNPDLTDEQLADIFNKEMRGEEWTVAEQETPDFSNVRSGAESMPTLPAREEPKGYWETRASEVGTVVEDAGNVVDLVQGSFQNLLAGYEEQKGRFSGLADIDQNTPLGEIVNRIGLGPRTAETLRSSAARNLESRRALDESLSKHDPLTRWAGTAMADAATSGASGAVSLVGGPAGLVAVGDSYAQAYAQGLEGGLKGEQLEAWAWSQAAPEAIAVVPAGKVIERIPVLGPLLKRKAVEATEAVARKVTGRAARVGGDVLKTGAGEYVEEAITDLTQSATQVALASQTQAKALAEFAETQAPDSFAEALGSAHRAGSAGLFMGVGAAPVGARGSSASYDADIAATERGTGDAAAAATAESLRAKAAQRRGLDGTPAEVQPDLFGDAPADAPTFEEQEAARQQQLEEDAAYDLRNRERAREENRAGLRNNLQRTVDERAETVAQIENDIEDGDTTSQTFNALTAARADLAEAEKTVADFDATETRRGFSRPAPAEDAAPVQRDFVQEQTQARTSKTENEFAKRRREREERAKKAAETEQKQRAAADRTQRRQAMDRLIEQYPDADNAELTRRLEAGEGRVDPAGAALEKKVTDTLRRMQTGKRSAEGRKLSDQIKRTIRANPDATPEQLVDLVRGATQPAATPAQPTAAPTKPDNQLTQEDTDASARRMAIEAGIDVPAAPPSMASREGNSSEDFVSKFSNIIRTLAHRNTNEDVAVQNLLRQGKVVIMPSQESAGQKPIGSAAQYVPEDNKVYLYADKINPEDAAGAILEAIAQHESVHAGRANPREGRSPVLAAILEDVDGTAGKIRAAARGGDARADAAVRKARADSDLRRENGEANPSRYENEEVVAYLAGELAEDRAAPLGRLRGVANDMRSGARELMRRAGVGAIDVDFGDIATAVRGLAQELVQTEMVGPVDGEPLAMVYNSESTGYQTALENGWVYDSADGRGKYVLSDAEATISPAGRDKLLRTGEAKLSEVLDHGVLYREVPSAAEDVTVYVVDKMPTGDAGFGQYDASDKSITIVRASVSGSDPYVTPFKEALMHEVQHYVQDVGGYLREEMYQSDPNSKSSMVIAKFRAANNMEARQSRELLDNIRPMMESGPRRMKEEITDILLDRELNDGVKAAQISNSIAKHKFEVPEQFRPVVKKYVMARQARNDLVDDYKSALYDQDADYRANITEREAFRTQADVNRTEESVRERGNPEGEMREQTSGASPVDNRTAGRIDVPSRNSQPEARAAGVRSMAAEATSEPQVPRENITTRELIRRLLDESIRTQTSDIQIAEKLDGAYRRAIKKDLGTRDASKEQQAEIEKLLTAVENANPEARVGLWNDFSQKYPETAKVLDIMRHRIDNNTNEYVRLLLSSGRALTPKEARTVKTLIANRGQYLTRAYNAFQRKAGRKWAEKRWADYTSKIEDYLNNKDLKPEVRANVEAVLDGIKFIEGKLTIPDNATLQDMSSSALVDMYQDHGGRLAKIDDPDWNTEDRRYALVNELARLRDLQTPDQRRNMAEETVKSLLGLTPKSSNFARTIANEARDPGTLKKKDFVPSEIQNLLGEMRNPAARVLTTLSTQGQLLARQRLMNELIRDHTGTLVVKAEEINNPGVRESLSAKNAVTRKSRPPVQLTGEVFGPLDGYYVHPSVADALVETPALFESWTEALEQGFGNLPVYKKSLQAVGRGLGRANRLEKITGVVLTPHNWFGNFLGSPLNLIRSGNVNFKSYASGASAGLFDYTFSTWTGGTTELYADAVRYLNIEAADVAEMQNILGNKITDYMDGKIGSDGVLASGKETLHKIGRMTLAGYAAMDNWTKIANYHERVELLKKYYAITDPKRPIEEIKAEAGHVTSYTNISNERVPAMLRMLESNGLTKFIPYFSEVFRTTFTNYNQGLLDLQRASETADPRAAALLRNAGMRRIIGNTLATIAVPAVSTLPLRWAAAGLMLATGDDEDAEEKRRIVGEFNREQDLFQVGVNKDGLPIYLPISQRLDPNGPVTDLLRMAVNTTDNAQLAKDVRGYLVDLLITPQYLRTIIGSATEETVGPSVMHDIFPEMMEATQQFVARMGGDPVLVNKGAKLLDSWLPGVIKAQAPYSQPELADGRVPTANVFGRDLLNLLGARYETLNPQRVLNEYGRESNDAKKDNRRRLNQSLALVKNLSDDQLDAYVTEYAAREVDRLTESYKNVRSMRAWGFSDEAIAAGLKEAKWSKDEITMLMSGQGAPVLSIKSIKDYAGLQMSGMQGTAREEYRDRINRALSKIEQQQGKLAEAGIIVKEK